MVRSSGKFLGVLVGVALFGQLGCAEKTSFDEHDNGHTASVSAGDEVDITLGFIGGSYYSGPDVSSSAVQFESASVIPPYNSGGPTVLFKFDAVASGTATISIPYTSPAPGAAAQPPFTLTVNVD
jgi:hypothetical protein